MSKHETPMTEGFWQSSAKGTFLAEYPLVRRTSECGARLADAVILTDEPHCRGRMQDYPTLTGCNVIVIQAKTDRMGMYLMGQALFSARLVMRQGATSVRSILLCHQTDSVLLPLLKPFPEVEVWISDRKNPRICTRAM
jgi:hypothetical protein